MDEGSTRTIAAPERHIIDRPRLTKILDESNARLILLVAPAGYGKTTLARQWLKDKPHVWYQATLESSDPAALARGLERLLRDPDATGISLADVLGANSVLPADPSELAAVLLERIAAPKQPLVIDDYHLIDSSPLAASFVQELARRIAVRVVLMSRIRPRWLDARMLAYREAHELGVETLAMTQDEAEAVLGGDAMAEELAAASNGWPVLLGLTPSLPTRLPVAAPPDLLYEFLTDELLRTASAELQDLLTQIALAPSLAPKYADERPELFEEGLHLGLLRREEQGTLIHPLLGELLVRRAQQRSDGATYLASVATRLLEMRAWDDAYAVIGLTSRPDLIGTLLSRGALPMLEAGRVQTVEHWLASARTAGYRGAVADLIEADLATRRGNHAVAKALSLGAATRLSDRSLRCRALIVAGWAAYFSESLPEADEVFRLASNTAETEAEKREALTGRAVLGVELELDDIQVVIDEFRRLPKTEPETAVREAVATMMWRSRTGPVMEGLAAAEEAYPSALQSTNPWVRSAYFGLYSHLLGLSGQYSSAAPMAELAVHDASAARFGFAVLQTKLNSVVALAGLRRYAQAARALRAVEARSHAKRDAFIASSLSVLRLRLAIEQRRIEATLEDRRTFRSYPTTPTAQGELVAMQALALACAGRITDANRLAATAEAMSRTIDIVVLTQAARTIATTPSARAGELAELVQRVEETGNFDACVVAIRGSAELEQLVRDSPGFCGVAHRVLNAALPNQELVDPEGSLTQSLSRREREVLTLLVSGLTNKQIGTTLFISEVTVKAHLRRIYAKLGVTRRTQAALIARELEESAG